MVYAFLCSISLLALKDVHIYLQLLGAVLIAGLYFLMKKKEREFIIQKINGFIKR